MCTSLSLPVTPVLSSDHILPGNSSPCDQTWSQVNLANTTTVPVYDQLQDQPLSWMPSAIHPESQTSNESDEFSSTRTFGMLNSYKYLDPAHMTSQRRASDPECLRRGKFKSLRRQLSNVRKKLEKLELDFQHNQGFKPSQADKQLDKNMRQLMSEQSQLKRQIKSFKEMDEDTDSVSEFDNSINELIPMTSGLVTSEDDDSRLSFESGTTNNNLESSRDLESMRNSLQDIEIQLRAKRKMKGRPNVMEEMTSDQLYTEKVDIQSALLQFEKLFGHPETEEEKSLTKEIYDRYRTVRRLVRRSSTRGSKEQQELETIPEDEAISLTMASPQQRINIEVDNSSQSSAESSSASTDELSCENKTCKRDNCKKRVPNSIACEGFIKLKSTEIAVCQTSAKNEENLHAMSRYELFQVMKKTKEDKKYFRRKVKEKEEEFKRETGRRLLKEDRDDSENVYRQYKNAKAKVKLIDALLNKTVDYTFF